MSKTVTKMQSVGTHPDIRPAVLCIGPDQEHSHVRIAGISIMIGRARWRKAVLRPVHTKVRRSCLSRHLVGFTRLDHTERRKAYTGQVHRSNISHLFLGLNVLDSASILQADYQVKLTRNSLILDGPETGGQPLRRVWAAVYCDH